MTEKLSDSILPKNFDLVQYQKSAIVFLFSSAFSFPLRLKISSNQNQVSLMIISRVRNAHPTF
jgi:hypothetical protein